MGGVDAGDGERSIPGRQRAAGGRQCTNNAARLYISWSNTDDDDMTRHHIIYHPSRVRTYACSMSTSSSPIRISH
jgi:hypothetical protein